MAYTGTTTPLGANATYTTGTLVTDRADQITGTVFSNQGGTLFIDQSADGTNWDVSRQIVVVANTGQGFKEDLYGGYVRLRYTNGGTAQGTFRLHSRFASAGDS